MFSTLKELIAEMELLPQERCTISPNSETLLRKVTQALEREAPVAQLDEACYTDQVRVCALLRLALTLLFS